MIINKINIFENTLKHTQKKIYENLKEIKYRENEIIHFIGDPCTYIDIIIKGSIEGEHIT